LTSIPVLSGVPLDDDATLVAFSQAFELNVALARFIAVSGGFTVANAVGINESGAFNLGLNYAYGGTLGRIFRIAHARHWYLGIRGDAAWSRAEAVLPAALVDSATSVDGTVTFNFGSLTQSGRFRRGSTHLSFVASPVRWLGLQASAGYEGLRTDVGTADNRLQWLRFGLGSSFRLNEKGVPLLFQLGAESQVRISPDTRVFFPTINSGRDVTWSTEGGVLYSDPKYVDVGLQGAFRTSGNDDRRTLLQILINHSW
jgi:hypothetical protein